MTRHYFDACDCCKQEILKDDPPYYTRLGFERIKTELDGRRIVPVTEELPRRDLCENCYRRVSQALIQAPESLWLLEGFEVEKK